MVVGRDTRTSGEMVRQAVFAGPALERLPHHRPRRRARRPPCSSSSAHSARSGGIAITASHNPAEWNALKFVGADGLFLERRPRRASCSTSTTRATTRRSPARDMRPVERMTRRARRAPGGHPRRARGRCRPASRPLRVVLDACNGAGSLVTPHLLEALGVEVVIPSTSRPTGRSRARPSRSPRTSALCATAVRAQPARRRLRAGHGRRSPGGRRRSTASRSARNCTLVLAARYVLEPAPGPVVTNSVDHARAGSRGGAFGCAVWRTQVGEANVTEGMRARPRRHRRRRQRRRHLSARSTSRRDSLVGMALILHLLAEPGQSVSETRRRTPAVPR